LFVASPLRADPCDRLPPSAATLKRVDEPITINNSYDHTALASLAAALARPGLQVLGLTRGNATVRFQVEIPLLTDRSGGWECASPQIGVSFGYSPMTVYVAREFAPGSCAYREVLEHEMRHVETYRRHLVAIEAEIADALQRRFAAAAPWRSPLHATRVQLDRELQERWLPYIEREMRRVEVAQAAIDSADEYARAAGQCGGEIERLLRRPV
jgi:hypothetical protein